MKKVIVTVLFVAIGINSFALQRITIHGKIERLSNSKNIQLSGFKEVPIHTDGTFEINGEIKEPLLALLMTDSSAADAIWLEAGEYTIRCKEIIQSDIKGILLRTLILSGPESAKRYNNFQIQTYNGFGVDAENGEDPSSTKTRRKERALQYMDSVFAINSSAPVLIDMIKAAQIFVGDIATQKFIQKLSPELKNNDEIVVLSNDLRRKAKIAKEKQFENFTMNTANNESFSLDSVKNRKAILLDFWSSWCQPCRQMHPKLIGWYQKYKDKGFEIISVSIDTEKDTWIEAMKKDGMEQWINVSELKEWNTSLIKNYFIPFIPFKFLLDGNMNVIKVENMKNSWIEEKDITELLRK